MKLDKYGNRGIPFKCLATYLDNREQYVAIQGVSKVHGHFSIQINDSFRNPMLMKVFQFYVHCFL